jgi:hypothetical protein
MFVPGTIGPEMIAGVTILYRGRLFGENDRVPKGWAGSLHNGRDPVRTNRKDIGLPGGALIGCRATENAEYTIRRTGHKARIYFHRHVVELVSREDRIRIEIGSVK